jgi:hypothetical protein
VGSGFSKRVTILGLCLVLAAVLVHGRPERPVTVKSRGLDEAFSRVGSWTTGEVLGFDQRVVDTLRLDDYTNRTYGNGPETVWVHIG